MLNSYDLCRNGAQSKPQRSKTASAFSPPSPKHKSGNRGIHTPSPLSLPQNNSVAAHPPSGALQSPSTNTHSRLSPLAPSFSSDRHSPQPSIRHVQSSAALNERYRPSSIKTVSSDKDGVPPSPSSVSHHSFTGSEAPAPARSMTVDSTIPSRKSEDVHIQRSIETKSVTPTQPPTRPAPPAPSVNRTPSLKSKLSLPNLRGRNVGRMRQDEAWNLASAPRNQDIGPGEATVQVEDMDFELVHPIIPRLSTTRSSEDSTLTLPDLKGEMGGGRLGADSPISMSSAGGSSQRSPTVPEGPWHKPSKSLDVENSMDAHRQRELKWVSVMSSVSSSQARKSKKVKRLLLEGVPSSVRFLVWAHLTDSKARGVPGVYAQLGQRVRASAYRDVRRDVQRCLADQPLVQVPQESLLSLLHTYLTMVPDVRYERGNAFRFVSTKARSDRRISRVGRLGRSPPPVITRGRCILDFCIYDGHSSASLFLAQCCASGGRRASLQQSSRSS